MVRRFAVLGLLLAASASSGWVCAQSEPEPAAAPQATPTPVAPALKLSPRLESDDPLFPRYPILEPNVRFWTRVFSEYSENQSVVHSMDYPDKVYEVLDFRSQATVMDEDSLRKLRRTEENQAQVRFDRLLAQIHASRGYPEALTGEARRVYQLYSDIDDDQRFKKAIGKVRSQRGLKERTQLALETSGNYLPAMESVFGSYQLPLRLTRLPLVESSFNVEAYSKVGAAGLWQFIPSSARIYMRLNEVVDDRRDPWTSTDAAARHLRDDYAMLGSWPLALTAYNHGRGGVAKGLAETGGTNLADLIKGYDGKRFGFASRNFYAEFLAASDVERNWKSHFGEIQRNASIQFEVIETKHYVPYETLRRLSNADDEMFRKLNPAYRPEVIEGRLYVPPGHLIRVPAGSAKTFEVAYSTLGANQRFDRQRVYYLLHKVRKGESLSRIAKKYGVTQDAIRSASGLNKRGLIRAGQIIKVPPHEERRLGPVTVAVGESKPGLTQAETLAVAAERRPLLKKSAAAFRTHKVRSGQTLSSIAKTYKVSIRDLRSANGLGRSSYIRAGQKLKVPTSG
ncbi:MAG: LysM peptidoglycan-binding domain-containing protein [Panacagrimonas sp.]